MNEQEHLLTCLAEECTEVGQRVAKALRFSLDEIRPEPTMVEDLHGYCGSDAARWAEQFRLMAIKLGYSDMDEGWLIGWFANAIERAIQVRHPPALPDYLTPAPSTNEAPR